MHRATQLLQKCVTYRVMLGPQEDLHVTGSSLMASIKISHKMTLYPQLCNVRGVTDEVKLKGKSAFTLIFNAFPSSSVLSI